MYEKWINGAIIPPLDGPRSILIDWKWFGGTVDYHSIKINIGPSNGGTVDLLIHCSIVLY